MKGAHRIVIQNKRIRYDFIIKRNITVIRGDSATGKTTLVDMIREHFENGDASAVSLICDKQCAVLEGRTWKGQLTEIRDSIVFIDEGNEFVSSVDFSSAIQQTDNYYVIVTREAISTLPYSVEEIYGIRDSGKYGTLRRTYNEFYHLYPIQDFTSKVKPELIVTEDSNSGYQFFDGVCSENNTISCISAGGKSNIFACVTSHSEEYILVIADGAAFGSEMNRLMELIAVRENITLYLPESFEWIILKANPMDDKKIEPILTNPEEYIDSSEYFSWERFFTAYLVQSTKDSYLRYSKHRLNAVYLQKRTMDRILNVIENVELFDAAKPGE